MVYTSFTENPFETLRVKREKNFWGFLYIFSWWMVDDSMIQPPQKKKHVLNHVRWMAVWNMANVWMAAWNLLSFAFVLKASNELPIRLSESCAMLPSQHLPS